MEAAAASNGGPVSSSYLPKSACDAVASFVGTVQEKASEAAAGLREIVGDLAERAGDLKDYYCDKNAENAGILQDMVVEQVEDIKQTAAENTAALQVIASSISDSMGEQAASMQEMATDLTDRAADLKEYYVEKAAVKAHELSGSVDELKAQVAETAASVQQMANDFTERAGDLTEYYTEKAAANVSDLCAMIEELKQQASRKLGELWDEDKKEVVGNLTKIFNSWRKKVPANPVRMYNLMSAQRNQCRRLLRSAQAAGRHHHPQPEQPPVDPAEVEPLVRAVVYSKLSYGLEWDYDTLDEAVEALMAKYRPADPETVELVREITEVAMANLVERSYQRGLHSPAYFLSVDPTVKWIVLSVRGTYNADDVLTDLDMGVEDFMTGKAHKGIVSATSNVYARVEKKLRELLARPELQGYALALIGHSLGAAVSVLLALQMTESAEWAAELSRGGHELRCFAVACPPILSLGLAQQCREYVTCVVLDNDFVPRSSRTTLNQLASDLNAAVDSYSAEYILSCHPTPDPELTLQVPGRVLHLRYYPGVNFMGSWSVVWPILQEASQTLFHRLVLTPLMTKDHIPFRCLEMLRLWQKSVPPSTLPADHPSVSSGGERYRVVSLGWKAFVPGMTAEPAEPSRHDDLCAATEAYDEAWGSNLTAILWDVMWQRPVELYRSTEDGGRD
eukprot:RCo027844